MQDLCVNTRILKKQAVTRPPCDLCQVNGNGDTVLQSLLEKLRVTLTAVLNPEQRGSQRRRKRMPGAYSSFYYI